MPRPKKNPKEVRVPLTAAVLPEIDGEVQIIADAQERTKSSVIEKLILRGLVAFRQDGKLTAEESAPSPPTIHAPAPKPRPLRDSPSHQKAMHFGGKGAKSEADRQLSESEFERLRQEQNGIEDDEEPPEE